MIAMSFDPLSPLSRLGGLVLDVGRTVPGWTVLMLLFIVILLLIGGRLLDLVDTTVHGVEERVGEVPIGGNETLGMYMPSYGYRELARSVWATVTSLTAVLLVLLVVAKVVNAFIKRGEEV